MNDTPEAIKCPRDMPLIGHPKLVVIDKFHRMTNSQRLAKVRAHLQRWLQINSTFTGNENAETSLGSIISESILIRDGFYTGRTFEALADSGPIRATWFMEPDELKIHDSSGSVIDVFQGNAICDEPLEIVAESSSESVDETAETEQPLDDMAAEAGTQSDPVSIPMPLLEYHPKPEPAANQGDSEIGVGTKDAPAAAPTSYESDSSDQVSRAA